MRCQSRVLDEAGPQYRTTIRKRGLMRCKYLLVFGLALVAVAGCNRKDAGGAAAAVPAAQVDAARLLAANSTANAGQWMSHGRDYSEQRFSPLTQVNTDNVTQLGLTWFADFDTRRGQESTPLMVDGAVYVTTAWSKLYAFDA